MKVIRLPGTADRPAAHVVASNPEQGWSLPCNGTVLFEDTGALLPGGQSIPPHQPADAITEDHLSLPHSAPPEGRLWPLPISRSQRNRRANNPARRPVARAQLASGDGP